LTRAFVTGGRDFLLTTARRAMTNFAARTCRRRPFRASCLADVIPAEVITTLAVIEQNSTTKISS